MYASARALRKQSAVRDWLAMQRRSGAGADGEAHAVVSSHPNNPTRMLSVVGIWFARMEHSVPLLVCGTLFVGSPPTTYRSALAKYSIFNNNFVIIPTACTAVSERNSARTSTRDRDRDSQTDLAPKK